MEKILVFKLGGKILDDPLQLTSFLQGFSQLPGKKILVHGGGVFADQLALRLGIPVTMHEGRRVTSGDMRDLVTMVYGGLLQKRIVAQLQLFGCDAIGLSGADARLLPAQRRQAEAIDFGYVGDIQSVRVDFLQSLLNQGFVPVLCPLSWDPLTGEILNSNADGVACTITEALAQHYHTSLLYCFDKPGVLLDLNDPSSLIATLDAEAFQKLKDDQRVHAGMLPKLENCFRAKRLGADLVLLASPEQSLAYAHEGKFIGTLIQMC